MQLLVNVSINRSAVAEDVLKLLRGIFVEHDRHIHNKCRPPYLSLTAMLTSLAGCALGGQFRAHVTETPNFCKSRP